MFKIITIIFICLSMNGCMPPKSFTENQRKYREQTIKRRKNRDTTIKDCVGRVIDEVVLHNSERGVTLIMDDGSKIYLGCYKYSIDIIKK